MKLLLLSNSTNPGESYLDYPKHEIRKFLGEKSVNALFIPYAAVRFSYDEYETKVENRFAEIGHHVVGIHRVPDPIKAIEEAEAIVVGGGNTWRLVQQLHLKGLMEPIRKKVMSGTPYIGWSAGSNIACPTLRTTNDMPIVHPVSFDTLNLVSFQINPHYLDANPQGFGGETREERIIEFMEVNPDIYVVGLRESTLLHLENDRLKLIGNRTARIFKQGEPFKELDSSADLSFLLKCVFQVLVIVLVLGLASCLETDSSKGTYDAVPSFITTDSGRTVLQNNVVNDVGQVYVPALDTLTDQFFGDYAVASFAIDYNNQTAGSQYYTADLIQLWRSPMTVMRSVAGELTRLSDDTIASADPYSLKLLNNMMFIIVGETAPEDRLYEYQLVWNTDSVKTVEGKANEAATEFPSLYLKAAIVSLSDTGTVVKSQTFRTFDMSELIHSAYAKTEQINNCDYRTVQFYLYYQTGKDGNGHVKYTASAKNPWKISQALPR